MPTEGQIEVNPKNPAQRARWTNGQWVEVDSGGMDILPDGYRRNEIGKTYKMGPRGGMEQVAGPNDTMINEAMKSTTGVNRAMEGIDAFDKQFRKVKVSGPFGMFTNPKELAVAQQTATDLMLRLKEQPYNLGVLNGPDLEILQRVIADPGSLKDSAFRQTVMPRLNNLARMMGNQYRSNADQFQASGGRAQALPPLYRAPDSQYTPDEWGKQGRVPAVKKKATAPSRASQFKIERLD